MISSRLLPSFAVFALLSPLADAAPLQEMRPLWASSTIGPVALGEGSAISRSERVILDVPSLQRAVAEGVHSATLSLTLFGEAHELEVQRVDQVLRHSVLIGRIDRSDNSEFVLALGSEGVASASIRIGTEEFELRYSGDGSTHLLVQIDAAHHATQHASCGVTSEHIITEPSTPQDTVPAGRALGDTIVDVAVFYTPLARQNGGGVSGIESKIAVQITRATQACIDSGVQQAFRLVYRAETNYSEVGTSTDLSRFRGNGDGRMDEVHGLRTTYGADLMALITDFSSSFCGVGYLMGNVSTSFAGSAFSVTVRTCLSSNTLAHEMGHNIGSHHDRNNAGGGGAYSYSFGDRCLGGAQILLQYRSIMAYAPGIRVSQWSSPSHTATVGGCILGANNNDNARSINNTKGTTSRFRSTKLYEWVRILNTGIPGTNLQPRLSGRGHINGTTVPIEAEINRSPAGSPGFLIVGFSQLNVPALGGILVPALDLMEPIVGSANPIVINANILQTLSPGTELYIQAFFFDPGAVQNVTASDGVQVTAL